MDIIEFALKMELDGKAFYEKAAREAGHKELAEIFHYLAEEEQRHFEFFKKLRDGEVTAAATALTPGSMKATKNIFVDFIKGEQTADFGDQERSAWKEALAFEEKAVKLYSEEADKESDASRKELLKKIADEERTHVYLIDNMLSYMSDPGGFVQSKQFADFQSWEGH